MIGMPKRAFAAITARGPAARATLAHVTCAALLLIGCACQSGAQQERAQAEQLRSQSAALFGISAAARNDDTRGTTARAQSNARADWSIVLAVFRGEGQADAARITHRRMQTEGRLPDAFIERRGPATAIAYGRYSGPDDPQAQRDLERIQEMEFNGLRPYRIAYLAPPYTPTVMGSRPEHNLWSAKAQFPNALYTLQIGVYGRDDLPRLTEAQLAEIRRKAEEAVATLRAEGELAYYYHGPRRSTVTVGLFDQSDFDPLFPGIESARLREARQRHPHNLYNGQGIRTRVKGSTTWTMQESKLRQIPSR